MVVAYLSDGKLVGFLFIEFANGNGTVTTVTFIEHCYFHWNHITNTCFHTLNKLLYRLFQ